MFFIMGINNGEKRLDFTQTVICPCCGKYGRYEVYFSYMCFSLFFIPIFKWNKEYYVRTTCCNSVSKISNELGERIKRGEVKEINPLDLNFNNSNNNLLYKTCSNCGFTTNEDFKYCPNCGNVL